MGHATAVLPLFGVLALAGVTFGQVAPIGPFNGLSYDSFEFQPSVYPLPPCLAGRVFASKGDLCAESGGDVVPALGWANSVASIGPRTGARFAVSSQIPTYNLDTTAVRFGGYFAALINTSFTGSAEFYDENGMMFANAPIFMPNGPAWTWNGWQITGNRAIKSVRIVGVHPLGPNIIAMDDMELVDGSACAAPITYCAPKLNSLGCLPSISSSGVPSATLAEGFVLRSAPVRNGKPGVLIYGTSGPSSVPFQGGTLCVAGPLHRSPAINPGGNPSPANDCSGSFGIDMNAFAQGALGGNPRPELRLIGTTINCQFWGRDPGFLPPNNTSLSDGLQYVVCL